MSASAAPRLRRTVSGRSTTDEVMGYTELHENDKGMDGSVSVRRLRLAHSRAVSSSTPSEARSQRVSRSSTPALHMSVTRTAVSRTGSAHALSSRASTSTRTMRSGAAISVGHGASARPLARPFGAYAGSSTLARPLGKSSNTIRKSLAESSNTLKRLGKAILSARVRALHVVLAIALLVVSLFGSLLLRTQMVQDSFTISQTQQNINTLTQDIQEEQVKLEKLQASLPSKASDLGMVPGSQPVTIDITQAAQQH